MHHLSEMCLKNIAQMSLKVDHLVLAHTPGKSCCKQTNHIKRFQAAAEPLLLRFFFTLNVQLSNMGLKVSSCLFLVF